MIMDDSEYVNRIVKLIGYDSLDLKVSKGGKFGLIYYLPENNREIKKMYSFDSRKALEHHLYKMFGFVVY